MVLKLYYTFVLGGKFNVFFGDRRKSIYTLCDNIDQDESNVCKGVRVFCRYAIYLSIYLSIESIYLSIDIPIDLYIYLPIY